MIDDHRDKFAITRMCRVLDVSPGGYYAWRTRPVSAREMANRQLIEKIKAVHTASYVAPRRPAPVAAARPARPPATSQSPNLPEDSPSTSPQSSAP